MRLVGIGVVLVVLPTACGEDEARQPLNVQGKMLVRDRGSAVVGAVCTEEANLDLRIQDDDREELANPALRPGTWEALDEPSGAVGCYLRFDVRLPDRDAYSFVVGDSRRLRFEHADLAEQADGFEFYNPEQFFDPQRSADPTTRTSASVPLPLRLAIARSWPAAVPSGGDRADSGGSRVE